MTNIFIVAAVVSFVFLVAKFLEMRYIDKESKPLKVLMKDTLFVYFSVILGDFVITQIYSSMASDGKVVTPVFIDNPSF
jgi:hypothetical protein